MSNQSVETAYNSTFKIFPLNAICFEYRVNHLLLIFQHAASSF